MGKLKKHFYSDLVDFEIIIEELNTLNISDKERDELVELAHSNLHHRVVDAVLSELSSDDKRVFLEHLSIGDSDKIWKHLNEKVDKIEDKIKQTAESLKKDLREDIRGVR